MLSSLLAPSIALTCSADLPAAFKRGVATASQADPHQPESSAQAQARNERDKQKTARRIKAAKRSAQNIDSAIPAYFRKQWDQKATGSLDRLSTLPLSYTPNPKSFLDPDTPFNLEGTEAGEAAEQERLRWNDAVHNVHVGVIENDWNLAYDRGWLPLCRMGSTDRLDMATSEKLVYLLSKQTTSDILQNWAGISQRLLIPVARREIGSEVHSITGSLLARLAERARHPKDILLERIVQLWHAFIRDLQAKTVAEQYGHPNGLVQIPANLFTSMAVCYYRARCLNGGDKYNLPAFLKSCEGVIAVPSKFGTSGAMAGLEHSARDIVGNAEHEKNLSYWFRQCELYRTWQRQGDAGIRYANVRWRERRNERAAEYVWEQIQETIRDIGSYRCWWEIDWRDEVYRNQTKNADRKAASSVAQSDAAQSPFSSLSEDLPPIYGKADLEAQVHEKGGQNRAQLPAKFTPALVSEFIHTFLHLKLPQQAEEVWNFCKDELGLTPTLIMWNARLLGHSSQRDSEAVEKVFMDMETKGGIKADPVSWSILVNSYFRAGKAEAGLERMQQLLANKALRDGSPDGKLPIRIYNVMLNALLWNDSSETAMQFLKNMTSDEPEAPGVDIYTANILLRYYSRGRTFNLAQISKTIELVERYKLEPDHYTFTTILDALLRAGRPDAVERIQIIMESMNVRPTVATYGAIIDHLVKNSIQADTDASLQAALALLRKMQDTSRSSDKEGAAVPVAKPNEITYTSLVQGFARWATDRASPHHLQIAEELHNEMLSLHIPPNRITYNSLMSACLAADDVAKALLYFRAHRDMKRRRSSSAPANARHASNARLDADDVADETVLMSEKIAPRTWQALIAGLVKYKHFGEAKAILEEMRSLGITLQSPSFQKLARQVMKQTDSDAF